MRMAAAYADILRADPVMAGQIKEHIPIRDLLDLLQLSEYDVLAAYRIPVCEDGQ
jgi:hypothetical protein